MKYVVISLILFSVFVGLIPYVDARGADEPCSYLNPAKYVRDSAGNCVIAQYDPTGVAPTQTGVSQVVSSTTTTRTFDIPSGNFSDLSTIFLLAISAFMVYKIFGGRFRQPRIKHRPRQNQKSIMNFEP